MSQDIRVDGCTFEDGAIIRFTPAELQQLRHLVHENLGIHIHGEKDYLLASKFSKLMKTVECSSVPKLIGALKNRDSRLMVTLAQFLTTNHTFFFREKDHFALLVHQLSLHRLSRPRIWCAAASSGEEVYTIAISLISAGYLDFLLLGSDISLEVLKACREGVYRQDRLRELPKEHFRYFTKQEGPTQSWRVSAALREKVTLKRLNLLNPLRFESKFHYIFCRNVMIYFDLPTQTRVLKTLIENLEVGGVLFLGHTEPLLDVPPNLVAIAPSAYRRIA